MIYNIWLCITFVWCWSLTDILPMRLHSWIESSLHSLDARKSIPTPFSSPLSSTPKICLLLTFQLLLRYWNKWIRSKHNCGDLGFIRKDCNCIHDGDRCRVPLSGEKCMRNTVLENFSSPFCSNSCQCNRTLLSHNRWYTQNKTKHLTQFTIHDYTMQRTQKSISYTKKIENTRHSCVRCRALSCLSAVTFTTPDCPSLPTCLLLLLQSSSCQPSSAFVKCFNSISSSPDPPCPLACFYKTLLFRFLLLL